MPTSTSTQTLLVGGHWGNGGGDTIDVIDPTHETVLASVPSGTAADVAAAVEAASAAFRSWSRTPVTERGRALRGLAAALRADRDRFAASLTAEVGKPASEAQGEVDFALGILEYTAEWDRRLEGEILPGDVPGETIHLQRAPLGVVGAICPWNFPLAVLCRKIAPALLAGNTVVVKPSEVAPLTAIELIRLAQDVIGFPPGVINVVPGAGATGAALVDSPDVSLISFTGHRDTGKAIQASAAQHLTRVSLELGGKAPAIVWKDADLGLTIPAVVAARHTNAGQVCTAAERILVHEDVLEEFTARYVAAVDALAVGDPAAGSQMGPMVNALQLSKTQAAVERALDEGAKIVSSERSLPGTGLFHAPVVLREVVPTMSVMTEEVFGPVSPIVGISSLEEAARIANDTRYGLSAYIFSRDYSTIMRTVDDLEFGEIYINRTSGESVHAHHAGFKESGIGGEDGKWGFLRYTQIKTAYHHYG